MLFLILHVVLLSGFGLLLKDAKNRGHRLEPIGSINYATAFLISLVSAADMDWFATSRLTLAFGLTNGITYSIGFVLVTAGLRIAGVVITFAVARLSIILPIAAAIALWGEMPNLWQATGVLLACGALPLLGAGPRPKKQGPDVRMSFYQRWLGWIVIVSLFVNSGISRLSMKAFNELCPMDQKPMYLVFLFGTTALIYVSVAVRRRELPTWWEWLYGVLVGFCNVSGSWAFLAALDRVDALIAFPVSGSGGVLFTSLVGVFLLGERLTRRSTVGVIITILALILVNLKEV